MLIRAADAVISRGAGTGEGRDWKPGTGDGVRPRVGVERTR